MESDTIVLTEVTCHQSRVFWFHCVTKIDRSVLISARIPEAEKSESLSTCIY